MNKYKLTVEHDGGKFKVNVYAKNYQSAIQQVMNAENCPENAITAIKVKYKKQ